VYNRRKVGRESFPVLWGESVEQKKKAARQLCQTVEPVFTCASRRKAVLLPLHGPVPHNVAALTGAKLGWFHGNYVANAGSNIKLWKAGPASFKEADAGRRFLAKADIEKCNGINFQRSKIRLADIFDGTSNTYLAGEKFLNSSQYASGADPRDVAPVVSGADLDLHAWADGTAATQPAHDRERRPAR
jgi:hypothetical protein